MQCAERADRLRPRPDPAVGGVKARGKLFLLEIAAETETLRRRAGGYGATQQPAVPKA